MLFTAAIQDIKHHKVSNGITGAVCLLGVAGVCRKAEDRWETIIPTCLFLILLLVLYFLVRYFGQKAGKVLSFGGADIKLMAGAMLFLGWQEALEGMLSGLCAVVVWYFGRKVFIRWIRSSNMDHGREIPLVPWLVGGICVTELISKVFDLFFAKTVLY